MWLDISLEKVSMNCIWSRNFMPINLVIWVNVLSIALQFPVFHIVWLVQQLVLFFDFQLQQQVSHHQGRIQHRYPPLPEGLCCSQLVLHQWTRQPPLTVLDHLLVSDTQLTTACLMSSLRHLRLMATLSHLLLLPENHPFHLNVSVFYVFCIYSYKLWHLTY